MKKVLIAILLLGLLPHASADYIHWVDFRLSAPVLRSALELDMASQGGEQPLDWIDILALAAAWRGGTGVTVADTQRAAQALRGDTPPERLPGMAGRYFSYYREAYGAALGGLAGHFAIRRTDPQTGEAEWIPAYGLKAFSPIAAGYPWSHYPDFGAQRSYGYARPHLGNDILGALGTPICAVEGGVVEALGWNQSASAPTTGSAIITMPIFAKTRPMPRDLPSGSGCRRGMSSALWAARAILRRRTSTISRRCTCISACS